MTTGERQGRTWMCTVVFLDIAGYTQQSVTRQVNVKSRLEQLIACAVADIPEADRIIVDTGDGAALCHLGDPEEALFIGVRLRESLRGAGGPGESAPKLRIGINLGPVKITKTLTGQPNPLGDGINNAQRVMSFAEPDQILASRSFYDMIACLSEGYAPLFTPRGVHKDKHGKEHEVFELLVAAGVGAATMRLTQAIELPARASTAPPLAVGAGLRLSDLDVQRLAQELTEHVGPLAAILVKKAVGHATDVLTLHQMLAEALPAGEPRRRYLAAHASSVAPVSSRGPATEPTVAATTASAWSEEELADAERRLAAYVGPLAKVLVRRAGAGAVDRKQFYVRLAQEIASEKDRQVFLAGIRDI